MSEPVDPYGSAGILMDLAYKSGEALELNATNTISKPCSGGKTLRGGRQLRAVMFEPNCA
jgi:hypothetical protein